MKKLFVALAVVSLFAGCSTTSPDVIQREDAQRLAVVQDATVLSVRPVTVDGSQSGIGGATGAVIGGVAGSQVGGNKTGAVVGVVGAVAGAVIGNTVERFSTKESAIEILIQMRNGDRRAIVQAIGNETLVAGEPVILVTTGGKTRVTRAPVITPSAVAAPRS
jgi:outer membrane lipoprotein SlyB